MPITETDSAIPNPTMLPRGSVQRLAGERIEKGLQHFKITSEMQVNAQLPEIDLPTGYAFIGGVARNVLYAANGETVRPPRDIDLAYVGDPAEESRDISQALASRYSPEDFAHGHGVQHAPDIPSYMSTRDFTMNQCIVMGDELIATDQAVLDIQRHVVRPTAHAYNNELREFPYRLAIKAVVQLAELIADGCEDARIEGIDLRRVNLASRNAHFDILLGLNKALERGADVTNEALRIICELRLLPSEDRRFATSVPRLVERMFENVYGFTLTEKAEATLKTLDSHPSKLTHKIGESARILSHAN